MSDAFLSSGDLWDIAGALRLLRERGGDEHGMFEPRGIQRLEELEAFLRSRSQEAQGEVYDLFLLVKVGKEQEDDPATGME